MINQEDSDSGFEGLSVKQFIKILQKAGSNAADKAMETMGYVVIGLDGWVVKKYKDGTIEKLEKIDK